jgi:hypothetical protein
MRTGDPLNGGTRHYVSHLFQAVGPDEPILHRLNEERGCIHLAQPARESQVSANRKRWARTPGLTDAIPALTAATNEFEAPRPTRKPLIALAGGCIKKRKGDMNRQIRLSHSCTGLVANPAQMTRPFKFGLPMAAHCIANGTEKDSATRTNGVHATCGCLGNGNDAASA